MSANESRLPGESLPPEPPLSTPPPASWHASSRWWVACLPLLIASSAITIDLSISHSLSSTIGPGLYGSLWLLGVVCLVPSVCLVVEKFRPIGWGLFLGCLPLLIASIAFTLYLIDISFALNGTLTVLYEVIPWLFGVVCLATPVCLVVKKSRSIGWGLLLAALLTLLAYGWFVAWITSSLD